MLPASPAPLVTGAEFRARWSVRRKLLLQLVLLPVYLLILEFLFRAQLSVTGRGYDAREARDAILAQVSRLTEAIGRPDATTDDFKAALAGNLNAGTFVPHPYVGFEQDGMVEYIRNVTHAMCAPRAPREYRVLMLGGSVAGMFFMYGGDRVLREELHKDPRFAGSDVRTYCLAQASYKQPQQLMQFSWVLALGADVDCVINLDGFNETALAAYNVEHGAHPAYPFLTLWAAATVGADRDVVVSIREIIAAERARAVTLADWVIGSGAYHSSIVGELARSTLSSIEGKIGAQHLRLARVEASDPKRRARLLGPPHGADLAADIDGMVRTWAECSRALNAICSARGILYLHVLQPTLHDPGSKPLTPEEERTGVFPAPLVEGVHVGYPKLRATGAALRESGVPFIDASQLFAQEHETIYYDHCHFKERGNELLAQRLAKEIAWRAKPPQK